MKKYGLLFILMFMFIPTVHATPDGKFEISAPSSIEAGKELEIKISVKMNYDEFYNISLVDYYLTYNNSYTKYLDSTTVSNYALRDKVIIPSSGKIFYNMQLNPFISPSSTMWLSTTRFIIDKNTPNGTKLVFSIKDATMELVKEDGLGVIISPPLFSLSLNSITITVNSSNTAGNTTPDSANNSKKSNNVDLKNILIDNNELELKYDETTSEYNVTIPYEINELDLKFEIDSKATATISGNKDLKVGDNKATILIIAEDGTEKTYIVNIHREEEINKNEGNPTDNISNDIRKDNKNYAIPIAIGVTTTGVLGTTGFILWKKKILKF